MSYLVACMLCSFVIGIMVGVMLEAYTRNYLKKKGNDDESL
jgi:ABC-type phosphate transport system permease subunit